MSIASRITAIEEHIRDVYDTIDYSYDTTDVDKNIINIPQNIFNGYINVLNDNGQSLWNNLEKVSASGETPVLENVETAPMKMVLNGNTSQDGTPTPDTLVEVKVVTGNNVVSVSGKQLFDKDNANIFNGYVNNANKLLTSNNYHKSIILPIKSNTTYTISKMVTSRFSVSTFADTTLEPNVSIATNVIQNFSETSLTITSGENDKYLVVWLYGVNTDTSLTLDEVLSTLQIEKGSTATPYVPYSKTDYTINLGDIELCKIGNYQDYLYKNNGSWYVHKEIGKKVVDENSSVAAYSVPRFRVYVANFVSPSATEKADILCDKLRTVTKNALASADNVISGSDNGRTGEMLVRINAEINTLDLFKQFLAENNLTIYYVLATPTEEEITNTTLIEQLEAISKAKSVKDKTYITQTNDELPFILDVEAIKEYSVE